MPTAEEAAAANLAWRAVNLPSSVTSAEQAQAAQYSANYYNVERPAQQARDAAIQQTVIANRQMIDRQEGWNPSGAHTQEQLAAHYGNAELGRQAYSSEQDYYRANPSEAFQREINNANYQQNRIVSGNGSYRATGELKLNTTAGEGGYTGRAATYKAAYDRQVYGIGAPNNEQEYYRRNAIQAATERPGFTAPTTLGDTQTRQARAGYSAFAQAMGLQGVSVAPDYQFTGQFLEYQRQAAYATPTRRDETFYMNELQKWAQAPVEQASAYHDIGMESGKAIPANPYEYQADLAVEFLKGAPTKSSEYFSPVSGVMSRSLPGGEGLQQFAWREAVAVDRGARRQDMPGQVSFMTAVTKLGQATGQYGPYGRLYGGPEYPGAEWSPAKSSAFPADKITWDGVDTSGRLRGSGIVGGTGVTESTGVLPLPYKSTSTPSAATVSAQNEYKPSGFLGLGGLIPEIPTIEQYRAYSINRGSQLRTDPVGAVVQLASDEFGAPVSLVQGVASRLSFGMSEYIPGMKATPIVEGAGSTKSVKTESFELPITREISTSNLPTSSKISGGNQTITELGTWLDTNYEKVDRTNPSAVKEYNDRADLFKQMQIQNPVFVTVTGGTKETVTEKGGTRIVTTETGADSQKVYASEWDKFVEGSGRVGRWLTGETEAKQKAYFETIKNEEGLAGEAKRGLFYIGTEVINKPAELAPAAITGAMFAGAAGMAPSFLAEVGAGSGITARGAQFLSTPGGASLARAATVGVFGSAYVYGVTNKFTATPEETKENIYRSTPALVAMYGGAGGFNQLPETVRSAGRFADRQFSIPMNNEAGTLEGFRTREPIKTIDLRETIDLSNAKVVEPAKARKYEVDLTNAPTREYVSPAKQTTNTAPVRVMAEPYSPFAEGVVREGKVTQSPNIRTGGGGTRGTGQVLEQIPEIDVRPEINLADARIKADVGLASKGQATGGIKTSRTLEQRNFKVGDPFKAQRRGTVSKGLTARERGTGNIPESWKVMGEVPAIEQGPVNVVLGDIEYGPVNVVKGDTVLMPTRATLNEYKAEQLRKAEVRQPIWVGYKFEPRKIPEVNRAYQTEKPEKTSVPVVYPIFIEHTPITEYPPQSRSIEIVRQKPEVITNIGIPYQKTTEKVIPYSRTTEKVTPYSRTTTTEKTIPKTSELVKEYPYEKITETPKPYERIIPVDPIPVVPIVGIPLGSLGSGSGGGGGGGHRGRRRRKVELFSFEMAEDTPIPTRFGLGGQVTEFVPGTRGLAINILKRSDIAPNRLFEMGGKSSDHL